MNTAPRSAVSARGWLLYATMSIVWGITYLFIKEAVATISPAGVVAGRTLLAGLILLPFALRRGALKLALIQWRWVLAFGAIEMAGPFLLLSHAEQTLPSGLTGLLVSTVPLFAALIAVVGGDRSVLRPARLVGLIIGFAGVAVIVSGPGLLVGGTVVLLSVGEVLLTAVLYAIAPFIIAGKLGGVPSLGTITVSLLAVGIFYAPIAVVAQEGLPSIRSGVSLLLLAVVCTAFAFIAFFALIAEVGPVRAPLFTYVNPVVAIVLGALVLREEVNATLLVGFPLIIAGCWLAATGGTLRVRQPPGELPPVAPG